MIPSVFSILLSISIINTGMIKNQSVGDINLPDSQFTEQTTLNSTNSPESNDFSYFTEIQLPKIRERSQKEQQRLEDLDLEQQKAKQEEQSRLDQEQVRITQAIKKIQIQQAEEAKSRAEQEAKQKEEADKQNKRKAAQAAAQIPVSPDIAGYEALIRQQCAQLGCDSDQVIRVMYCESKGNPAAYNLSGASGLFQHMSQYWPGRAKKYGISGSPEQTIWDPRAQIIVTTAMFAEGQAGQWDCK